MALSKESFIVGQYENLNYSTTFSIRLQYPTKKKKFMDLDADCSSHTDTEV
jgi:hypothetical protein